MKKNDIKDLQQSYRLGFTLVEALGAVVLLIIALTTSVVSLSYVTRNERMIASQAELDMDAQMLVERLRRDLWRTSRDMIILHPPGDGPYEAISFPVVRSGEPIVLNESGDVEWAATVVYHLRSGSPSQVRRTVFDPRINLSETERRRQLEDVAHAGEGSGTYNGANAITRTLVENPVDWQLDVTASQFDAYAPTEGRRTIRLGSGLLEDGQNDLTFRAVGKNANASGSSRYLGIDTLTLSASGLEREAEWQTIPSSSSPTQVQLMGEDETWSGNTRLWFAATANGEEFTVRFSNDAWEERNFFATGVKLEDLIRRFIQPGGEVPTFALQLDGNRAAWSAAEQTRDFTSQYATVAPSTAVRVFVRGSDVLNASGVDFDGGWIGFNGTNVWARFTGVMRIREAFIAECAVPEDPFQAMNYVPDTRQELLFNGSAQRQVLLSAESDRTPFFIERDKSYLVGIYLDPYDSSFSNPYPLTWTTPNISGIMPSSFYINGASLTDFNDPNWSGRAGLIESGTVYALQSLRAGYAPEGIYHSQIIDTQMANPNYLSIDWAASLPAESALEIKVRAGGQPDLSDTPDWDVLPVASPGLPPLIFGRYVQVKVRMEPGVDALTTPELRDFTLRWRGGQRYADLSGIFSVGPNHGIYEVDLNGSPLLRGVTVHVSVYKDVRFAAGKIRRMYSSAFAEIVPRN